MAFYSYYTNYWSGLTNNKQQRKIKKLILARDNLGRAVFLKAINSGKLNYYKSTAFG